jgi:putative Mg2+ transporter-C (MgtC) family protein
LWDEIARVAASEFSDIGNFEEFVRVCMRLTLAAVLGAILGFERESSGKSAGVRTHMLVAMGSALIVVAPLQAGADDESISRVIQGLVAGIGFLCAGTIIKADRSSQIKGLTTSAGLWMTAAIGIAAGLGRESTAVLAAFFALLVLLLDAPLARIFDKQPEDAREGRDA